MAVVKEEARMGVIPTLLRTFRLSAWLGWQIESNWADPFLFAVYSLVKPLSGAAILVVMYGVITGGDFASPIFSYMYLGSAFYIYVGQVMTGISWAVIEDREHYKTLKYMVVAPIHFPMYLFGRGVARFIIASVSVFVTILVGKVFLDLQVSLTTMNWPLFIISLLVGVVMLGFLGLMLAGIMLLIAHQVWGVGEAVAGSLYLFSGAIFPLQVLPPALRWIGYLLPTTYWLELMRRSMTISVAEAFPTFASYTNSQIFSILMVMTIFYGILSFLVFGYCNHQARERGLIDMVTNY
jgi:ABC-2 type transport system permease protein